MGEIGLEHLRINRLVHRVNGKIKSAGSAGLGSGVTTNRSFTLTQPLHFTSSRTIQSAFFSKRGWRFVETTTSADITQSKSTLTRTDNASVWNDQHVEWCRRGNVFDPFVTTVRGGMLKSTSLFSRRRWENWADKGADENKEREKEEEEEEVNRIADVMTSKK